MNNKNFNKLLNRLSSLPVDWDFLASNKQNLLAQINSLSPSWQPKPKTSNFVFRKLAIVLGCLVILLTSSGGVLAASQNSLPNNFLYPLKRLSETVILNLTSNPAEKAELALSLAQRRLTELELSTNQINETQQLALLNDYQDSINLSLELEPAKAESLTVNLDNNLSKNKNQLSSLAANLSTSNQRVVQKIINDLGQKQQTILQQVATNSSPESIQKLTEEKLAYLENKIFNLNSAQSENNYFPANQEQKESNPANFDLKYNKYTDNLNIYKEALKNENTQVSRKILPQIQSDINSLDESKINSQPITPKLAVNQLAPIVEQLPVKNQETDPTALIKPAKTIQITPAKPSSPLIPKTTVENQNPPATISNSAPATLPIKETLTGTISWDGRTWILTSKQEKINLSFLYKNSLDTKLKYQTTLIGYRQNEMFIVEIINQATIIYSQPQEDPNNIDTSQGSRSKK